MGPAFRYTVSAEIDTEAVAGEWIAWLEGGHLEDVRRGGASRAELVRLDSADGAARFEVHYEFPSRDAFARYEATAAPALRAEGLAKFPPSRGVRLTRRTGVLLVAKGR